MKKEPEYNLDNFSFYDNSGWWMRLNYFISMSMVKVIGITSIVSPVGYKTLPRKLMPPTIIDLGISAGIKDSRGFIALTAHEKRFLSYKSVVVNISLFFALIQTLMLIFLGSYFLSSVSDIDLVNTLYVFLILILFVVFQVVIFSYSFRIATFIVNKYFADTLCVASSLYLLLDLSREDSLLIPNLQRELLFRVRNLARNIMLLPYCYESADNTNNTWMRDYFKKMERRVREYERWIIAPKENTLNELRKEVDYLTNVFVFHNYEDATYELPDIHETIPQSRLNQIVGLVGRIIGVAIPGFFLGMLYFYPEQINSMSLDKNIVGLIAISWLLLTIDASLGLGVVDRITGLAKAIRDLK